MPPEAAATATPQVRETPVVTDSILKLVQQFGLPLVMLGVILWWAKNDLVQPLLDAHFSVVAKIVDGQETQSDQLENIGDKLDKLIEITK